MSNLPNGYIVIGKMSSSVRPRTLSKHVRICTTFIPANWQTNNNSALFLNRYRSASRLGRKGFESQSWMALAITPRHKRVSVVRSCLVADAVTLIMLHAPVISTGWVAEWQILNYSIKNALAAPNARIGLYFSMAY
jgi:hypothetical protein